MGQGLYTFAILSFLVAISIQLEKTKVGKQLSAALIVIILGALCSNIDLIPSSRNSIPLYEVIFIYIVPVSLFYLLLDVNLTSLRKAGVPILVTFLLGTIGTFIGVLSAHYILNMSEIIGEEHAALAGMITGTYTGGSVNFNSIAIHYEMQNNPFLFAGTTAVDNILTTVWMLVTLSMPFIMRGAFRKRIRKIEGERKNHVYRASRPTLESFALLAFIGVGAIVISISLSTLIEDEFGVTIASILIISTIALIIAQTPLMKYLQGSHIVGMFGLYLFLAVIGAYCDFAAFGELKEIGYTLLIYISIVMLIHGLITFSIGLYLFKDPEMVSVASQANIGGASTALALAKTWKRNDLMLPGILVGSLGVALGTYLGILMAAVVG